MKTENTLENKAKFFALYWGQSVYNNPKIKNGGFICLSGRNLKNGCLELTPLSQISDEDAIEVFDILFGYSESHKNKPKEFKIEFGKDWSDSINRETFGQLFPKGYLHMIDHLRSKDYAVPWLDLTVEDLIAYGWVKLKS